MDEDMRDILSEQARQAILKKACEQPIPELHVIGREVDGREIAMIVVLN